jgi:hypothetical protein
MHFAAFALNQASKLSRSIIAPLSFVNSLQLGLQNCKAAITVFANIR